MTREGRTFAPPEHERGKSLDELRDLGYGLQPRPTSNRYLRTRGQPSNYEPAMWAFAVNRLAGVLLVGYLFFHLLALLFLPGVYQPSAPGHWVVQVVDVAAVGSVTFHGLNGLRLLLSDLGLLTPRHRHYRFIQATAILTVLALLGAIIVDLN